MIKSLAVYGDSFGTHSLSGTPITQHKGLLNHWSLLLKKEYDCKITNYALSGSSVYYSYTKFKETHHLHDCVIFLVTESSRYIKPLNFTFGRACVTNKHQIDVWKKTRSDLKYSDIVTLDRLENWFDMTDSDFNYDVTELAIESMLRHRKDVVLLPCFNVSLRDSFRQQCNIEPDTNLCSLYYKQMDELKLDDSGMNTVWQENAEYISGHLTPEYNRVAYENISFFIKNGFWDWKIPTDFLIETENREKYYTKAK